MNQESLQNELMYLFFFPQKQQTRRSSSSVEEKGAGCSAERPEEDGVAAGSARGVSVCKMAAAGSLSDGSERDSGAQDSSNDADSEASESEWAPRPASSSHSHGHMSTPSSTSTLTPSPTPLSASSPSSSSSTRQGGAVEQLVTAVSKVNLAFSSGDCSPAAHCFPEEQGETQSRDNLHHQHHQGAFQALSHSYTPSSKECSIQSCLHQFTSVELLMGNNKLLCESCTERRQKQLRKSSSAGKTKHLEGQLWRWATSWCSFITKWFGYYFPITVHLVRTLHVTNSSVSHTFDTTYHLQVPTKESFVLPVVP